MYQKMYTCLFNAITDSLEQLERANYGLAAELLRRAQADAEELCLRQADGEKA